MTPGDASAVAYHPWTTYMWASEEARRRGDRRAGTDHLVLGLLEDPTIESVLGVSLQDARDALDALDRQSLDSLGIDPDVDAPPLRMRTVPNRPTLKAVVKDRLRMTPKAKAVLQEAGRPMRRGGRITAEDVLARLLVLEPPDPAAVLFAALGVNVQQVRERLTTPTRGS
ncbi:MAG: Clp protease N-terminal domain-containing protein [Acidimicrobiales bacterium]